MTPSIDNIVVECIQNLSQNSENSWLEKYSNEHKSRFINDIKYIQKLLKKPSVIGDLGAAPFATPLALQKLGHTVDAFDIDPDRFKNLEKTGLNFKKVNLDNWESVEENIYDLLILTEVFEHLRGDLITLMKNIHAALKPGGILFLTTPNFRSISGIYKFFFKGVSYSVSKSLYHEWKKLNELGHMGHVREYTFQELKQFFMETGFEIMEAKTSPALLGKGIKNKILFNIEKLFNPLTLGSNSIFVLKKT